MTNRKTTLHTSNSKNARRRGLKALLNAAAPAAGACALLLLMPPAASLAADLSAATGRIPLAYSHVPDVARRLSPLRDTAATQTVAIEFALKPRNASQIQPLLDSINTAGSPNYGHYLTQAEYRSRFSPTTDQIAAVVNYAKSQGLTVTGVSASGMLVRARGTAAQMESAFGVTLRDYVSPDSREHNRIFHAPDREPTFDAAIAPLLTGVLGLSNAAVPHNNLQKPLPARFTASSAAKAAAAALPKNNAANATHGTVTGTVYDIDGNPLANATVQLVNTSSSGTSPATVASNSYGNFEFSSVTYGTYTITGYSTTYNGSQAYDDNSGNPETTVTVSSASSPDADIVVYISLDSSDIRSLYGLTSSEQSYAGQNQVLGLVEFDTFVASDITTFEQEYNLTSSYPAITPVSVAGATTTGAPYNDSDADEITLDIDMLLNLAYNAKQIRVYEGPASDVNFSNSSTDSQDDATFSAGLADVFDAMANDSTPASVISCSWGQSETETTQSESQSEAVFLRQLALQGQTLCAASGDEGAYDDGTSTTVNVDDPGSQPTVVCVGGLDLTASFNHSTDTGTITNQTSWWDLNQPNEQPPVGYGGGGGISVYNSIPSWQTGAFSTSVNTQGSTTMRNTPDVSLYASDDYGGYNIYVAADGGYEPIAGTSAAAPLWAAMIADANVKRIAAGKAALGEATPEIYALAESSSYNTDFYDIKDDSNNGYYDAVQGYDNSSGWGSPKNGSQMISDLAAEAAPASTSSTAETRFDFNGDGHSDLIWYNTGSGALSVWDMNDQSVLQYGASFTQLAPSSGWQPVAAPDVNGDGVPDLIWWNSGTGELSAWTLAAGSPPTVTHFGADFATLADTTWKPVAAADVTGTTWELVFQNTTSGDLSRWLMNGTSVVQYGGTLGSVGANTGWHCVGAPDLDGDGHSDLLFWNSGTGEVSYWSCNLSAGSSGTVLAYHGDFAQVQDTTWHLQGSEDTNGDGHPDLIWWNATSGDESRWLLNGTTVTAYGGTDTQVQDTTWVPTAIR